MAEPTNQQEGDIISGSMFLGATGSPIVSPSPGQYADTVMPPSPAPPAAPTGMPPSPAPPAAPTEMDLDSEIRKATAEYLRLYPADQAAKRAAQGAQAGYAQRTADAYRSAAATPMPQAPLPQYKALPEPPKPKYREPWEAVGNVFSGLMLVAGLATRQSGTAAMNAASAAMQAQQQGDERGYQDALAYFKESYARTIDSNNQERQKYEDIWKNEKLNWDAKMARIEAEATANKNMAVAAAARGSRADDLASYIGVLNNAKTMLDGLDGAFKGDPEKQIWHTQYQAGIKDGQNQGLTGTALKQHALQYAADKSAPLLKELKSSRPGTTTDHERNVQARMEVEKSKPENAGKSEAELRVLAENQIAAARGRQPTTSVLDAPELRGLEGKEYLAKLKELDPGIGATVEKVARGDEAFPKGRDPVSVAVRAAVNIADPSYTEATFPIIKNTMADYRNVKVPGTGGILAAGNLVGEHAVSMKKAAQEMRNGNFKTLNQFRNYLQSKGNFPALAEYEVFKSVVARETDRFTAGARPTVTETKEWRHVLDGNATPQELEAVSNALLKEVLLPKFKILGRAYNTGVFAVDDNNEPDQNNPRYKPWTFWASPRWRDIADQTAAPTAPSPGGMPDINAIQEELRRRGQ